MAELSLLINPKKCLGTVAYIAAGNNPEPFTWSMIQLVQFCNEYVCTEPGEWIDWDHGVKSGQILQRNALLVQRMMGDWILFLDPDHNFEPDLVYRLLKVFTTRDMDVLGGYYAFKEFPHQPMAWMYMPEQKGAGFGAVACLAVAGHEERGQSPPPGECGHRHPGLTRARRCVRE